MGFETEIARLRAQLEAEREQAQSTLDETVAACAKEVKQQRKAHRETKADWSEDSTEWQLYVKRLEKEKIDALRAQEAELREYQHRMYEERNDATERAVDLMRRMAEISISLERVRGTSKAGLLEQVAELQTAVRTLGERRTLNQRRIGDSNLDRQRAKVATQELHKTKSRVNLLFDSDTLTMAKDYPRLEAHAARLENDSRVLCRTLKVLEATELKPLIEIACPPRPMEKGHFDARMRFMIMKLVAMANLCPTRVPIAYLPPSSPTHPLHPPPAPYPLCTPPPRPAPHIQHRKTKAAQLRRS